MPDEVFSMPPWKVWLLILIIGWSEVPMLHGAVEPAKPVNPADFSPPLDEVEEALRAIARRVEAEQSSRNADAAGIAARVAAMLKRQSPKLREGFIKHARVPPGRMEVSSFGSTLAGMVFAGTPGGVESEVGELESLCAQHPDPLPLRFRMASLACSKMGEFDSDRRAKLVDAAIALARELLTKQPASAQAHARLAECLHLKTENGKEGVEQALSALRLDPQCWRAMLVLGMSESARAQYELLPGGAPALGEGTPDFESFARDVYETRADDSRTAAMLATVAKARVWFDAACSAGTKEAEPNVRKVLWLNLAVPKFDKLAALLRGRRPSSLIEMQGRIQEANIEALRESMTNGCPGILAAGALGADDPHLLASTVLMHLVPEFLNSSGGAPPSQDTKALITKTLEDLERMMKRDDVRLAARACEAHAVVVAMTGGGQSLKQARFILQSVTSDPWRYSAWELLEGVLAARGAWPALNAANEIRLALCPSPHAHRECAAAAAKLNDWERSKMHLDHVLKAMPGDVETKVHLLGVLLCEAVEGGRLESVSEDVEELREMYAAQKSSLSAETVEDLIVNLIVFTCLQKQWVQAEALIRTCVDDGRLPTAVADEIRALMPK